MQRDNDVKVVLLALGTSNCTTNATIITCFARTMLSFSLPFLAT